MRSEKFTKENKSNSHLQNEDLEELLNMIGKNSDTRIMKLAKT